MGILDKLVTPADVVPANKSANQLPTRNDLLEDSQSKKRHVRFAQEVKEIAIAAITDSIADAEGRWVRGEIEVEGGKTPAKCWTIDNIKEKNLQDEVCTVKLKVMGRNVELEPGVTHIKKVKATSVISVLQRMKEMVLNNEDGLFDRCLEAAKTDKEGRKGGKKYEPKYDRYFNADELKKWEEYIAAGVITAQD